MTPALHRTAALVAAAALAVLPLSLSGVSTADAAGKGIYKNCTALNKKYPHGVGKSGAKDKVKSGKPVTTFKRDTKAYKAAIKANRTLDRDKDGVACEKR